MDRRPVGRDRLKIGGQAAIAIGGDVPLDVEKREAGVAG